MKTSSISLLESEESREELSIKIEIQFSKVLSLWEPQDSIRCLHLFNDLYLSRRESVPSKLFLGSFKVVKNSLAKIAVSKTKSKDLADHFNGPLAIVFSEELTSQPKIISDFTKDNENLSIVGGFMDGEIIDKETISKLASLPSLDSLRSKIIGSLTSSASKIAGIVNKPGEQIAQVLSAKSQSGEAA